MKNKFNLKLSAATLVIGAACLVNTADAQVYVSAYIGGTQGLGSDGVSSVPAPRSVVASAFGAPQGGDNGGDTFYALGFGGIATFEMSAPVCNGAGADLEVFETTFGNPACAAYPEKARVWASQDLCSWVELTTEATPICHNGALDLGCLPWAKYIRIQDVSDITNFDNEYNYLSDGYDVDGIKGYAACAAPSETGLALYAANGFLGTPSQGLNENGGIITPFRSNSAKALGLPLNPYNVYANDASTSPVNNNFFSLGNGGTITVKFPVALIDGPGADVQIFETTFGDKASRTCGNYPEKAKIEGSCDGERFFDLVILAGDAGNGETAGSNIICRDGKLDFNGNQIVNYIRITDVTFPGVLNFPGVGDGYDVDAVLGLQNCLSQGSRFSSDVAVDNGFDIFEDGVIVETYPNPVSEVLNVSVTRSTEEAVSFRLTDMVGRVVYNEKQSGKDASILRSIDMSAFPAGIYMISVESAGYSSVSKIVKN
jgi:hypothetical protein